MVTGLLSATLAVVAHAVTMDPPSRRVDGVPIAHGELVECGLYRVDVLGRRTLIARTDGAAYSWPVPLTAANTRPVTLVAHCTDREGRRSPEARLRVRWVVEEVVDGDL